LHKETGFVGLLLEVPSFLLGAKKISVSKRNEKVKDMECKALFHMVPTSMARAAPMMRKREVNFIFFKRFVEGASGDLIVNSHDTPIKIYILS
jgi:hypothetical protein